MVDAMDNSTAMPLSCFLHFLTISLGKVVSKIHLEVASTFSSVPPVSILDQAVTPFCSREWFYFFFLYYLEILFLLFSGSCCLYYKPKKIRFAKREIFLGFEVQIKRSYILTQQDENSDHKVEYFLSN